jgi:hypothetical protein
LLNETTVPEYSDRHPAIQGIMRFFPDPKLAHAEDRQIDASCHRLAAEMLARNKANDPELSVALRHLLDARDAFIRAARAARGAL